MKILVTGNNGYIGALLCGKLLAQGFEVVGFDSNYFEGCKFQNYNYKIKEIRKDIREIEREDLEGVNTIIHLAALSNDLIGAFDTELTHQINYMASVRLAKLAKNAGAERFIFSSSCSVYGSSGKGLIKEDGDLNPITAYAKSKVDAEREIARLSDADFSPIFLRNATVYGISPMLRMDLVVNNLVGWAYITGQIKLTSDGTPWRPLIHIEDLCQAFIAALKAPRETIHNQIFNVGRSNGNYQVGDIAELVRKMMPRCQIEYNDRGGPDKRSYRVDFSKIEKALEGYFAPQWDLERGIAELCKAFETGHLYERDFMGDKYVRLKRLKELVKRGALTKELFWKAGRGDD